MKAFLILIIASLALIANKNHFGWGHHQISDAEMICTLLVMMLYAIEIACLEIKE